MRSTVYASGCVEVALRRTHWWQMSRWTRGLGRTGSSRISLFDAVVPARCATPDVSGSTSEVEVSVGVTAANRYVVIKVGAERGDGRTIPALEVATTVAHIHQIIMDSDAA